MTTPSIWDDAGLNQHASGELEQVFGKKAHFDTPKPTSLLERIVQIATSKDSIVLDSFGGSGTTAHAVLNLNARDGGNRRFIICEMLDYVETVTAERVRRVMDGYGEVSKAVVGTGGAFDFYTIGPTLFMADGNLNEVVGVEAIRNYVAYTEGIPTARRFDVSNCVSPYCLGATVTSLLVFYYERDRVTTLDLDFLASLNIRSLSLRPEQFVIYADTCALDKDFLYRYSITFKRIPRDITHF